MPTVLLLRHGLTAVTGSSLAGRAPGLHLDDRGRAQAESVAERLAAVPIAAVVTSPLERCAETAQAVVRAQKAAGRAVTRRTDRRLIECDYGDWTGQSIKTLAKEPLWATVQAHPAGVRFPGGESMAAMSQRAVAAVLETDAAVAAEHGPNAVWVACSHGDVIKSILADALGLHLDLFQRIVVDPCSVSAVRYSAGRPFVVSMNDVGADVSRFLPPPPAKGRGRRGRPTSEAATVGGGAGGGAV